MSAEPYTKEFESWFDTLDKSSRGWDHFLPLIKRAMSDGWCAAMKSGAQPPQATNSDYAAALKVYREYTSSGVSTIEHFVTFPSWCEERLHSSTNIA